jgi:hypothetical protein
MTNKYKKGDHVTISSDEDFLHQKLHEIYSDNSGRQKIIDDVKGTSGRIKGRIPERPLEVLYMKTDATNSWWLPINVII